MTTDITELAHRLKLEVHRAVSNFSPQMNIKTRDLKELVEALEKAQRYTEELREWNAGLAQESCEPVAWMHNNNDIGIPAITVSQKVGHYWMAEFENVQPLYRHAQSAPVVPDELLKEYLRLVQCMLSDYRDGNYGDAQRWIRHIAKASDDFERKYGLSPWEMACKTCRASMLAAAPQSPGSEPAPVPGSWIPVSERMPEDEQEVLTINKIGHRFVSFFDKHSGLFFDRLDAPAACCIEHVLVTHWMPLPAGPKEVR
ncbi:Eaa1 [Klebsiella pneumoniae subsp. ozaenae]|uniref:Eaa1 n=1 Tax=Klebsiella pneumoniae subsp. ozaenae TaxID=574 RepID=A0A378ALG3_KLEPO|nr:Eaa1 [Klebsiella pneumoniae subsp. ozaenae]